MAYRTITGRSLTALGLALILSACSTDALSPNADIDSSARVGAIRPQPQVEAASYPQTSPTRTMSDAVAEELPAQSGPGVLPMIDSDAAVETLAGGPLVVPEEGVNMDAMLGVEPVLGLAEAQSIEIAEGNASQPVVGGIGEDNVRQLAGPQSVPVSSAAEIGYDPDLPPLTPEQLAAEKARNAALIAQQRRMQAARAAQEEQQLAMLVRPDDPVAEPEVAQEPERMPASEVSCRKALAKMGVTFRDIPRISEGRSCGIAYPVELSGLSGGIGVKPAVKLNCQITLAFAKWVKNELAPSARARYLSGIKTVRPLGGYSCRTMNSRRGNPMSEHARGNAIDIGKFVLKSGKEIDVRKKGFFAFREKGLLKAVRSDSCKYFTTVLGPGSDPFHKDHFHFDLRTHKGNYRHCD